jgi:DNA-directed RNA polymerase subunit E'/Rpb7
MEHSVLFEEQVSLVPNDFSKEITSINDILLEKLKMKLENKCSRNGYVLQNSLKILSRSLGKASLGRYVGDYVFYVQLQGNVINPPDGIVLEGEVISKNKMGLYINYKNAIRVIVPRDLHIGNEEFDSVMVGDTIKVEIKKSRFQVNDESILSVGIFVTKSKVAETDETEDESLVLENE